MIFSTAIQLMSSPITMVSLSVAGGLLIGKIKIFGITLGIAATLVVSIGIGHFLSLFNIDVSADVLQTISSFSSSLFVATIGISAGNKKANKNLLKTIPCCVAIIFIVFFVMKIVQKMEIQLNYSTIIGVLCGSLTSSPGLASAINNSRNIAAYVTAGYGSAYIVGLFLVVLFVQIYSKKQSEKASKKRKDHNGESLTMFLCQVFVAVAVGRALGEIPLPFVNVTIGNTGGVLITGLVVGFLRNHKKSNYLDHEEALRSLGLSLFLSCNGLLCGMSIKSVFSWRVLLYSLFFAAFTILISYACARLVLRFSRFQALVYICGVMTSTPAFSAITELNDSSESNAIFTTTYISSLVTFVLLIGII